LIYTISKLFTYIFLPPGIFIFLLLIASFFVNRFRKIFIGTAITFYLLSNSYVADLLLAPLEKPFKKIQLKKNVDAVVILGGGSIAGSPNTPLKSDAYKRAVYGIILAYKLDLPIIYSGGGLNSSFSEADAFLDVLKEIENSFKIKVKLLDIESKSLDTYQNAKFTKEIFKKTGIHKPKILLVTSSYHMIRSMKLFSYFGFKPTPAPTDFKISKDKKSMWDLFPNFGAFKKSYIALHEYFGLLSLYLRLIVPL